MDEQTIDLTTTASMRRAPLPASLPRPVKRASTRKSPWRVPAHVRVIGAALDVDQRAYVGRKLGMKLGKFATAIERVSVRVTDVNGPRGGVASVAGSGRLTGLASVSSNAVMPSWRPPSIQRSVPRRNLSGGSLVAGG